jgi:hypothetical protein
VHAGGQTLEELALELFLQGEPGPRVLFPRDGAVFFFDPTAAGQGIPAWIAARREEVLEVRLNGQAASLRYPFRLELPVRPGAYRLEVRGRDGQDSLRYQVR